MITSAQIKEHKFDLSGEGAYSAESVDKYMDVLSEEFDSLYSENREIIKRLSVFAKKIEDYKRNEGVVADTLLTAQKSASQTIAGAADVVDKMLESAKGQGKKIIEAAHKEADSIKLDRDVIITEAQKTAQEIAKNAAENAQNIIAAADEKAREIIDNAQNEADGMMEEVKNNTDEYIKQANEENESEISRRLDEAQRKLDESQTVLDNAKSEAENTVNEAKSEAELIKEEAENIRAEAQRILDEARVKAEEIKASAAAERDDIINKVKDEANAVVVSDSPEVKPEDDAQPAENADKTEFEPAREETAEVIEAVEAEDEKIGNINEESDVEKIEEEEIVYQEENPVVIDGISSDEDIIISDSDISEPEENSEEADEFFSESWNDVNVIENDVPVAVDSFTLDMGAFGDIDDTAGTDLNSDSVSAETTEPEDKKASEAKADNEIFADFESVSAEPVSDETDVKSVKHDTVNPFDATGSDNIDDESDVLSDFEIDFSIFEEDPDKEEKSANKRNEKKNSKKSKRSRRK